MKGLLKRRCQTCRVGLISLCGGIRHTFYGNAICTRGVHGQLVYIDPEKLLVVAWYSSTEQPPSHLHDHWRLPLIDKVVDALNSDKKQLSVS